MTTDQAGRQAGAAGVARPLRRDAERNRQRILRAASAVLADRGLEASLDDVAHAAGVGVGTVYRRFSSKEALVEALFDQQLTALVTLGEHALAEPDPWTALVSFFEGAAEELTANRGLRQIFLFTNFVDDHASRTRDQIQPISAALVKRAQAAGVVRADLRPTDIPVTLLMLAAAADYTRPVRPDTWRRYLALFMDSLAPERTGTTSLPEPPLTPDELQHAMQHGTHHLRQ
jgi:AcrR family transcriptional regulator